MFDFLRRISKPVGIRICDQKVERAFMEKIMPLCKDKVSCQLGVLFGRDYNLYVLSAADYRRVKHLIH